MKKRIISKFKKLFSFEEGIDITDDVAVLYRRNIVIKNIMFLSNLAYTVILTVVSFISPTISNWIITIFSFPFTFLLNTTIKKIIHNNTTNLTMQQIAMYLSSFYMFLSSILIYFKLKTGAPEISEAGYILLYYSLVVVSLYQDKRMLKTIFLYTFVIVTFLHFTTTYALYKQAYASNVQEFLRNFFLEKDNVSALKDIALRTLILLIFMIVIYVNVGIGQYVFEQRKQEQAKRIDVESDFSEVVGELFNTVLDMTSSSTEDIKHVEIVAEMSKTLAEKLILPPIEQREVYEYSIIQLREKDTLSYIKKNLVTEADYQLVRMQAIIGSKLVKRIKLSNKCDEIVRAVIEGWANKEFVKKMNSIQSDLKSQIILMCDLYTTLRLSRPYKRPHTHMQSLEILDKGIKPFIREDVYDKFIKYIKEFENIFNS